MKTLPTLAVLLLCAARAAAHDFWIEPASFAPQPGQTLRIRFIVGERLAGDPVPRPAGDDFRRFVIDSAGEQRTIPGRGGADPAGQWRVAAGAAGTPIVIFHSRPIPIEIEAPKFTQYLKEEGLEWVLEQRAARGEAGKPGREVYARNAKSLLRVGPQAEPGDRAVGLPLELIAGRNPALMKPGDELPLRLLRDGKPLAGALVVAVSKARPAAAVSARSDAQGRVRFRLDDGGMWLVKAVHIDAAADAAIADWESQWASLTFELPAP